MFVTSQVAVRYTLRAPLRQLDVYNTTECLFFFCLFVLYANLQFYFDFNEILHT
jgi:hypothetical protein